MPRKKSRATSKSKAKTKEVDPEFISKKENILKDFDIQGKNSYNHIYF